jgi:hypothetical protein
VADNAITPSTNVVNQVLFPFNMAHTPFLMG